MAALHAQSVGLALASDRKSVVNAADPGRKSAIAVAVGRRDAAEKTGAIETETGTEVVVIVTATVVGRANNKLQVVIDQEVRSAAR